MRMTAIFILSFTFAFLCACSSSVLVPESYEQYPVIIGPVDHIGGEAGVGNLTCGEELSYNSFKTNYFILGKTNVLSTTLLSWKNDLSLSEQPRGRKRHVYLKEIQASTESGGLLFLVNTSFARTRMAYALCNTGGVASDAAHH